MHDSISPLLELNNITRFFPGVVALDHVSIDLRAGEVHALVGENGAGKSTLINIVSGVIRPDAGTMRIAGREVVWHSPVEARQHGIATVHQEAELFGTLSVAENMALEQGMPGGLLGIVPWREIFANARRAVALVDPSIDVRQTSNHLSVAQRHMTGIAAAISQQARVLVLDEPTSALTAAETTWLFRQIARLKSAGVGVLYISHRQEEIFQLADCITVLRDGRRVWSGARSAIDEHELIRQMVGRPISELAKRSTKQQTASNRSVRLDLREVSAADDRFRDASLAVRAGEIVGIYGLVGSGRSELAQALFGLAPIARGTVWVDGRNVNVGSPREAVAAGIAYLPEDRLRQGIFRGLSVRANVVVSALRRLGRGPFASGANERSVAEQQRAALAVKCRDVEQSIGELSGGNQQKVILARWLLTEPAVLLLDEPTRGVDVGAKDEIHRLLAGLAERGAAIVLISSELNEVLENSDRVLVFRQGSIVGEFAPGIASRESVAAAALGNGPVAGGDTRPSVRPSSQRSPAARWSFWRAEWSLLAAVVALVVVLAFRSDSFLTGDNLRGLLASTSVLIILSLGAAVVILAGGIDISLGAIFALSSGVAALVLKCDAPISVTFPSAVIAALSMGAGCGLANAALALAGRIHPIVVTLGTMTLFRGALVWLTGGQTLTDLPHTFVAWSSAHLGPVNGSVLVGLFAGLVTWVWLAHLRSGRFLIAVGASSRAAALAGISRWKSWLAAFGAGGLLAALAAVVELSQTGAVQSGVGAGYELRAIAAAVIGGVSISGGRGSVVGVCLGALLLSLISNALVLWQISRYHYSVVTGGLLLAAVLVDLAWRRVER